jgi:hypothetical protein
MDVSSSSDRPWARLHVVRGAPPERFLFLAGAPSELSVGSASSASLCLAYPGVAPRQFELAWDGAALWLQDPLRLGRTLVNSRPLNEWLLIEGDVLIAFGGVRLWAAARLGEQSLPSSPNFAALERARREASPIGVCRRSPTVRLPNQELSAEELDRLLSGVTGS